MTFVVDGLKEARRLVEVTCTPAQPMKHDVQPCPSMPGRIWCAQCHVLETTCPLENGACHPGASGPAMFFVALAEAEVSP